MAKGTWHYVGVGDDLLHLGAWYYGDMAMWPVVFWANQDIYGDDFEKVPAGARVFIPDVETAAMAVRYYGRVPELPRRPSSVPKKFPGEPTFRVEAGSAKELILVFRDGSEVVTGPRGVEYAAAKMSVGPGVISDALGRGVAKEGTPTAIGVPVPRQPGGEPWPEKAPAAIPNILRVIAWRYYGHHVWYHDVLAANGLDGAYVIAGGRDYVLPPRARRHLVAGAAKWRERLGRR